MKKILSIVALIVYILSINTLVHASTMGFFSHTSNGMNMDHCQSHTQSSTDKTQSIDCCELALSNEYSNTQILLECNEYLPHIIPNFDFLAKDSNTPNIFTPQVAWSPWRNPNIKYHKFSDLFGIIVNLS
ncbi:MAG: hypothetical protein ACD_80C00016G0005 [uncultured bacterium (gcode 4)]|uniref:Uncharacterized protein n=1 Tax=uncultured bacterium (gcode 4) TaxID=1234023 RepID=K1XZ12_9BACT|nr:MAG: hypothetical protein ACD_80C00016G0005 [uncultured bacterium (gcode 4)]